MSVALYESPEHRREIASIGMWTFLLTEMLFFGGAFAALFVYGYMYPDAFQAASNHLNVMMGTINTAVLLTSSFFVALAVEAAHHGKRKAVTVLLGLTVLLAITFLVIKGFEYRHEFHLNHFPGKNFHFDGPYADRAQLFYSLYFTMTGLHGIHVLIGIGLLSWLAVRAWRGDFSKDYCAPVEVCGLYWHLVDIVWIFLFPLLYLIGRS